MHTQRSRSLILRIGVLLCAVFVAATAIALSPPSTPAAKAQTNTISTGIIFNPNLTINTIRISLPTAAPAPCTLVYNPAGAPSCTAPCTIRVAGDSLSCVQPPPPPTPAPQPCAPKTSENGPYCEQPCQYTPETNCQPPPPPVTTTLPPPTTTRLPPPTTTKGVVIYDPPSVQPKPDPTTTVTTLPPPPPDTFRASAGPLDFGSAVLKSVSGGKELFLVNTGSIPFRPGAATVGAPFKVLAGGTCASTPSLNPGARCSYLVSFAPTSPGLVQGTVTIKAVAPAGDVNVPGPVSGTGSATPVGQLAFSTTPLDLGVTAEGTNVKAVGTLINNGNAPVVVSSVSEYLPPPVVIKGKGKTTKPIVKKRKISLKVAKNCVGKTLNPGQSCPINFEINPTTYDDFILRATGQAGEVTDLPIFRKRGKFDFSLSPASADFGILKVGQVIPAKQFTVTNTGAFPVTLQKPSVRTIGADAYVLTTTCTKPLPPKATCTVDITLVVPKPTAPGPIKPGVVDPATKPLGAIFIPGAALVVTDGKISRSSALRYRVEAVVTTTTKKPVATTKPPVVVIVPPIVATTPTVPPTTPAIKINPELRLNPAVGPTGRVTIAEGRGFPADAKIWLHWEGRSAGWSVVTGSDGSFSAPILVKNGEPIGGRTLVAEKQPTFDDVTAPYLVQLNTFRPPGYNGSDRLVTRG